MEEKKMDKPPERVRILGSLLRDLQEKMTILEIKIENVEKKCAYLSKNK